MEFTPGYEEAHLIAAAVRVLTHVDGRNPTPEEIAGLIKMSPERVYILVHELRRRGILRAFESPYDIRLEVADPVALEALPRGSTGPAILGELEEFHSREKEKREEMERMFLGGEADKRRKDRVARLEKEFRSFKGRRGGPAGLFRDDPAEERSESEGGAGEAETGEPESETGASEAET